MNYTNSQLEKWKIQLNKSCRRSNQPFIYDTVVKKFEKQISNGAVVKLNKSLNKTSQNKLQTTFKHFAMVIKNRCKSEAKNYSKRFYIGRKKKQQRRRIESKKAIVFQNSALDDNAVLVSEQCQSDGAFEVYHDISSSVESSSSNNTDCIVSSTPKPHQKHSTLNLDPPSRNLRCGKYRHKTYIQKDDFEEAGTSLKKDTNSKQKTRKLSFQEDESTSPTTLNCFTLQDLFNIITDEENDSSYREYISKGKSYVKVESNDSDEGDVVVIKLPAFKNRKTTIDMTASKDIAELMFLPVLAGEKERCQISKESDIGLTSTTTSTTPHLNDRRNFPQLSQYSPSPQQGPIAYIPATLGLYQPNLIPVKPGRKHKEIFPAYMGNNSLGTPYIFLPHILTGNEIPYTVAPTQPEEDTNNINNPTSKKGSEKKDSKVSQNATQSVPIRVTSTNGYDNTHFVDLTLNGSKYSDATSNVLGLNECNTIHFETAVKRNSLLDQSRKRTQPLKNEKTENVTKAKPKSRSSENQISAETLKKSNVPKKATEHSIAASPLEIKHTQPQNESNKTDSFLACLDMPSLNDDSNEVYQTESFAERTQPGFTMNSSMNLLSSTYIGTEAQNQFPTQIINTTTSSLSMPSDCNLQSTYTNCSKNNNATSQTVTTYSYPNTYVLSSGANDLLERFFNGEVGEILENDIDINENLNNVQVHKTQNQNFPNAIVCEAPIGSVITTIESNPSLKTPQKNGTTVNNHNGKNNTVRESNSDFYADYSIGDDLLVENLCYSFDNNNVIHYSKEPGSYNNCFVVQHQNLCGQQLPPNMSSTVAGISLKYSEKVIYENNNVLSATENTEETSNNESNMVEFRNFNNIIEDHSYSINRNHLQHSVPQNKEHQNPLKSDENVLNKQITTPKDGILQPLNISDNSLYNNYEWKQSEHMESSYVGVSEAMHASETSEINDEYSQISITPPSNCFETNYSSLSENSLVLRTIDRNKSKSNLEKNNQNDVRSNITVSTQNVTDHSSTIKAAQKESDLWLPPLELEAKLDNEVLDLFLDSDSIISSGSNNGSIINHENEESLKVGSNVLEKLTDSNEKLAVQESHKPSSTPSMNSKERITSSLKDKNNEVLQCRKINFVVNQENDESLKVKGSVFKKLASSNEKLAAQELNKTSSTSSMCTKERITSWLEDKNNEVHQSRNAKSFLVNGHGKASLNIQKIDKESLILNKRRSSEICNASPIERPNLLLTIDSIPNKFIKAGNSNIREAKKTIDSKTFSVEDMANFFNVTCFSILSQQSQRPLELRNTRYIREDFERLSLDKINILYKFAYRYFKLYKNYFDEFCYYSAKTRNVNNLCRMFVDCQRYKNFPKDKFFIVYKHLIKCKLTKKDACEKLIAHFERRTSTFSNAIMEIIIDSNWTLFPEQVKIFIYDQNTFLKGIDFEKMAKSFIINSDCQKLVLFWHCIFKLRAAEIVQIQGYLRLQTIIKKYNISTNNIRKFYNEMMRKRFSGKDFPGKNVDFPK